jgi:hypothetical protein
MAEEALRTHNPPLRWHRLMETAKNFAAEQLISNQSHITLILAFREGVKPTSFPLVESRVSLERAQLFIRATNPSAVAIISTVWFVPDFGEHTHLPIRDSDQRREGLSVNMFYRSQGKKYLVMSLREIERAEDGRIIGLGPNMAFSDGVTGGDLCRLFPLKPFSRAEQTQARRLMENL